MDGIGILLQLQHYGWVVCSLWIGRIQVISSLPPPGHTDLPVAQWVPALSDYQLYIFCDASWQTHLLLGWFWDILIGLVYWRIVIECQRVCSTFASQTVIALYFFAGASIQAHGPHGWS